MRGEDEDFKPNKSARQWVLGFGKVQGIRNTAWCGCGAGRERMHGIYFLWIHVPHEACLNVASVSGQARAAAQAVSQVAKAELLFQASAIKRLLHEVMDVAELKVSLMSVTLVTSHDPKPVPANLDAL